MYNFKVIEKSGKTYKPHGLCALNFKSIKPYGLIAFPNFPGILKFWIRSGLYI